jgi:hypothetical protein
MANYNVPHRLLIQRRKTRKPAIIRFGEVSNLAGNHIRASMPIFSAECNLLET